MLLTENPQVAYISPGIPSNQVADYTIEDFRYVSTAGGKRQWKMIATQAFLYNKENMVHSLNITAYLYDGDGKITVIKGLESKYSTKTRDLEVFGEAEAHFPDGFVIKSHYMKYYPSTRLIEIPVQYFTQGAGLPDQSGNQLSFSSQGLHFAMDSSQIELPQDSKVYLKSTRESPPKETEIKSDQCRIDRTKQIAYFTMSANQPVEKKYVVITQPDMVAKGRTGDMHYGSGGNLLNEMTLYRDVTIVEKPNKLQPRYATSSRADFDSKKNTIILREFPQVYQGSDTVTGDVVIVHRDTDIVEVEQSNAFSEGKTEENEP